MNYRSVADMNSAIIRGLYKIPLDVELVVGIPRSGMLAASMLALHRNLPLVDLEGFLEGKVFEPGHVRYGKMAADFLEQRRKVLVLDDSLSTGDSMFRCKDAIERAGLKHEIIFGVVYLKPGKERGVDVYFEEARLPRVFEWNLMGSALLERTCCDLDGVLCRDPTPEENDDGKVYMQFIEDVEPLWIPRREVGWIVTSRLEKYREATRQWLSRQHISYRHLAMLDLPDKKSRVASGCTASYKASVYDSTDADLFVESSFVQALEIARITQKNVLCVETSEMIQASLVNEYRIRIRMMPASIKTNIKKYFKRFLKGTVFTC